MSLSVAIMAQAARRHLVEELLARLDRPTPVHYDSNPEPSADPNRVWATCAGAWRLIDQDADWGLVLQDDVIACRDLIAGTERALRCVPADSVVSLYLAGHRYIRTTGIDTMPDGSWLVQPRLVSGQAIVVPTRTIDTMLARCETQLGLLDDNRIANHFFRLGYPAYFSVPSLVDHRPEGSLIGHPVGRVAYRFIGADRSALDIEWRHIHV